MSYFISLPNGSSIKHNPILKENVIFTDWLKSKDIYDDFIKIANLSELFIEKNPECFFVCLNWDKIEQNDELTTEWNWNLDSWLRFISQREWTLISNGIENNDELKKELFKKKVIKKLNNINFNSLTYEQFLKLDKILN